MVTILSIAFYISQRERVVVWAEAIVFGLILGFPKIFKQMAM